MRIEHLAIWARDIEALRAFYERFFEASASARYVNEKKRFQSYFLSFASGARRELMQRPDIHDSGAPGESLGYAHLAMAVGSETRVDALSRELVDAGHRLVDGPRRTGDGYYESVVLDPEGNRIEITV